MKDIWEEKDKINTLWENIIEMEIATEKELQLVTSINGYNIETLNDIIYVRTGYNNLSQLEESEDLL